MSSTGPSVHLLLDTGHAVFAGANLANLARCYRDRISQVHAKDVRAAIRARAEDWSSIKAVTEGVYTVPSEGLIDYREEFGQFAGCDEWIVIEAEQDPKKAPPLGYGAFGYPHLRHALSTVDLS